MWIWQFVHSEIRKVEINKHGNKKAIKMADITGQANPSARLSRTTLELEK